jgi:2-dehydro-3-deoxy-D-arabinonate dehydratase
MKVYLTTSGILVEHLGNFCLDTESDWDSLVIRQNLYQALAEIHAGLPALDNDQVRALMAAELLPPMSGQELWASGVTYLRSKVERQLESKEAGGGDFYQRVYEAERPELFFKATRHRVVGSGGKVRIRRDSAWNVPEPELVLAINNRGEIYGYSIGNDMRSRSIEGENPLYLPQAKTYDGCAAVGPCILVTEEAFPTDATIALEISRAGAGVFAGTVAISQITRTFTSLAEFLFRECSFPAGALLMTGTGIVPEFPFTLQSGDIITISIDHIGILQNQVA